MVRAARRVRPRLTGRQESIYRFIREEALERGFPPTVRDIAIEFGIASPNGVMCRLKALENKGYIHRERGLSRGIALADQPARGVLPLAGQVAAGVLLEAVEWPPVPITFDTLFGGDDLTAAIVEDDALIADGIREGDYAIVRDHQIVGIIRRIARKDGGEWLALKSAR